MTDTQPPQIITDFEGAEPGRYLVDKFEADGTEAGPVVIVLAADGTQTWEDPRPEDEPYVEMTHAPGEAIRLPDAGRARRLTALGKPEPSVTIERAEFTDDGEVILHLDDGTTRPATPEEIATFQVLNRAHGEAFVMNRHRAFEEASAPERPLPRHRPPKFKDPEAKVATRLPPNVFGAPRAVR